MNHTKINFEKLTKQNFNEHSLDTFVRHQDVTQCWRNVDGEWKLLPIQFTEEWDLEKCRSIAKNISENLDKASRLQKEYDERLPDKPAEKIKEKKF